MVRTSTDRIAELEQKIAAIKARDERKAARAKPETKHLIVALHGIDRALKESAEAGLRGPLDEARSAVASCLGLLGVTPRDGKARDTTVATKGRRKLANR